ncbi:diphthamide synthesis protein [Candidatus Pacearchaeota archaeon]|nr:diphthamide synthesis protein [Candidatus Pacearchaeota archaeon]
MKQNHSIVEINEKYDLELEKVLEKIKSVIKGKGKEGIVLLQFADGLKPFAVRIVDYLRDSLLEEKNKVEFLIWFGSCFGACDTPVLDKELENKIDLVIQFGHSDMMPGF